MKNQDLDEQYGGTPAAKRRQDAPGKRSDALRQSGRSVGGFGHKVRMGGSVSNFGRGDAGSVKGSSVRDPKDDSFDLEDFEDVMEQIELQGALAEKKRMVSKVNLQEEEKDYKDSFLVKFFES